MQENASLSLENFKFVRGSMPTDPPKRQGPKGLALSMLGGKSTYLPAPNLNETSAVIDFSVHGFITNKNNDQLPVGFLFSRLLM